MRSKLPFLTAVQVSVVQSLHSHVPLILDDALVHTDDERISTMFNMLSQAAKDQQIIVLSCRTKAFSDLGGTRAFIETEAI